MKVAVNVNVMTARIASRVIQFASGRSALSRKGNSLFRPQYSSMLHQCLHRSISNRVPSKQAQGSVAQATGKCESENHLHGLRLRLDLHAEQLIDDHREALREVLQAVSEVPEATQLDIGLLKSEIGRLGDGFFMLVVAGEYNSGKSTLVNALLGRTVLAEGPTPTTSEVTKLKYSDEPIEPSVDDHGVLVMGEPVQVLANRLQIVDTPGTNAIDRSHEALTRDFLPLCDIVLFVTSADRPFSESERQFLESIRKWGKKVILVVNKTDLLETKEAEDEVLRFVSSSARSLLGNESKVFALSARVAKQAKQALGEVTKWEASGFEPLENYINESLDSVERLRLKLRASASVGQNLSEKYISVLSANKAVVSSDLRTLGDIERLLERHEEYIRKGYPMHFARADSVLNDAIGRADLFLDTHVRVANSWNLTDKALLEQAFDEEVIRGTSKSVQRQIHAVAEWLTDSTSKNLTDTTAAFSRRVGERERELESLHREANLNTQDSSLRFSGFPCGREIEVSGTRERLVSRLTENAEELVGEYLSRKEGKKIADRAASSAKMGITLGFGSLSSFSFFLFNASSISPEVFFADPVIPMLAGGLGALSASFVSHQRRKLRTEIRSRTQAIRTRLQNELRARLEEQLVAHVSGIRQAVQPFADFSGQQANDIQNKLDKLSKSLTSVQALRGKLEAIEVPNTRAKD